MCRTRICCDSSLRGRYYYEKTGKKMIFSDKDTKLLENKASESTATEDISASGSGDGKSSENSKKKKKKKKEWFLIGGQNPAPWVRVLSYVAVFASFFFLDFWLQIMLVGERYSLAGPIPLILTVSYSMICSIIVFSIRNRTAKIWIYSLIYYLMMAYVFIQYGAYLLLEKFIYMGDLSYFGEGGSYFGFAIKKLGVMTFVWIFIMYLIGRVIKMRLLPHTTVKEENRKKSAVIRTLIAIACVIAIIVSPMFYKNEFQVDMTAFTSPAYEYDRFTNSEVDMRIAGVYGYLSRDIQMNIKRANKTITEEDLNRIDSFFEKKSDHEPNEMTGIYAGKNVISVLMESVDDWLVNPDDMPVLYELSQKSIYFEDFYTPDFANGWTFNTEFAYNNGVYPYSNGNTAASLADNSFEQSIPSVLKKNGYTANMFHYNDPSYYDRGVMSKAFGYEAYHSYKDYEKDEDTKDLSMEVDSYAVRNKALFNDIVPDQDSPFYSFIISYSAHLPYDSSNDMSKYALEKYPQYDANDEIEVLRAKAHVTDDFLGELIEGLKEKGVFEDTVLVLYGDHYSYGINDVEKLQAVSEENGCNILERTPALIYCGGNEKSVKVEKTAQTIDIAPTLMNLLGLPVSHEVLGYDVFDKEYPGFAIFLKNGWINNKVDAKEGEIKTNNGMSDREIRKMNDYVKEFYAINDLILDSDYYALGAGDARMAK